MAHVVWTDDAIEDLDGIAQTIDQTSRVYASRFVTRVVDVAEHLETFPQLGRVVPEFANEAIRELIFQNFRIIYRLRPDSVEMITVVHGAVDLQARAENRDWSIS